MPANALTDRDHVDGGDSGCIDDQHIRLPDDESSDDDISFGMLEEQVVFSAHFDADYIPEEDDDNQSHSSGFEAHEALDLSDDDILDTSARVRPRRGAGKALNKKKSTIQPRATIRSTRSSSRK